MITQAEFEAGKTKAGGFTRKQLAMWGVSWPPSKGWKNRLVYQGAPLPKIEDLNRPAWNYAKSNGHDDREVERLSMKALYQQKSGDYSY